MDEKYIVFLDIDGTVYCRGEIVPRNRDAIRRARAAGHKIFINTARSLADIPEKILDAQWDGIVAALGCTVIAEGRIIRSVRIPTPQAVQTFDYLTRYKVPLMFEGEQILLCNRFYPDPDHAIPVGSGAEIAAKYADHTLNKCYMPVTLYAHIRRELETQYRVFQHRQYAEFSLLGHDKATGMQCVLDHYGTDTAHCIAMGDSINDLDMLRYAGTAVAMGDASDEVRSACGVVTCSAEAGGVAEALERLLHLDGGETT